MNGRAAKATRAATSGERKGRACGGEKEEVCFLRRWKKATLVSVRFFGVDRGDTTIDDDVEVVPGLVIPALDRKLIAVSISAVKNYENQMRML